MRGSVFLALDAAPPDIVVAAVASYLETLPDVARLPALHGWGMTTTESTLKVHLMMPGGSPSGIQIDGISQTLADRFSIQQMTLQTIQGTTQYACSLHPVPVIFRQTLERKLEQIADVLLRRVEPAPATACAAQRERCSGGEIHGKSLYGRANTTACLRCPTCVAVTYRWSRQPHCGCLR